MMHYNPFGASTENYLDWLQKLQQGLQQPAGFAHPFATPFSQMFSQPFGASTVNPWANMANLGQQFGGFASQFAGSGSVNPASNANDFWGNALQSWTQLQQTLQAACSQLQDYSNGAQMPPWMNMSANAFQPLSSITKLQQLQYVVSQLCKLVTSGDANQTERQELSKLIRTLVEEVNGMTVNPSVVQYINQARAVLGMQRIVLEEQLVQASLTPYKTEIERYINTCKLWQECCEAALAMFDVYQQFGEQFSETFASECVEKSNDTSFDYNNPTQVLDFFVQSYEQQFGELLRSENFGITYGQLTDSISAVRIDQQQYIDASVEAFGLPSKREMDTTHKRANKHSKTLRRIEASMQEWQQTQQQHIELKQQLQQLREQIDNQSNAAAQVASLSEEVRQLREQLAQKQAKSTSQPRASAGVKSSPAPTASKTKGKTPAKKIAAKPVVDRKKSQDTSSSTASQPDTGAK